MGCLANLRSLETAHWAYISETKGQLLGTSHGRSWTETLRAYDEGLLLWGEIVEEGVQPPGVLLHEAAHAVTPRHVLCPHEENKGCDEGWDGAYGYQAGALRLWSLHLDPASAEADAWSAQLQQELDFVTHRVLAP